MERFVDCHCVQEKKGLAHDEFNAVNHVSKESKRLNGTLN